MKFSHIVELITVNKPTNEFYLEISYMFSFFPFRWFLLQQFNYGEFEIMILNALFSQIETFIL